MRKSLFVAMATASLLTACGGGGGGDAAPAPAPAPAPGGTTPPTTAARVTLTGLAAKGLMANADVTVLPVNADGSIGTTVLGSTTTNASGTYSLSFDATAGMPYVIRIAAKADGSTTHLDEIRGSQPLPAGFALRALTVPATSGNITTSATVTPFSEMATAAAGRATGGITAANAAQAQSTIAQLLGFNPTAVATAPSTAATASADAQKLAILLTAVSKLAADGGLGCATATPGEQTRCITEKLAAAASTSTLTLQTGGIDVAAALGGAVTTVLSTPSLAGAVPSSSLTVVQANLACTGTACTAAPATGGTPPGPSATALAIASAKQLFTEIRSDFATLFSRGGATALATGAANTEAFKFSQSMQDMQAPLEMTAKDLGALLMAADFYGDYKAGRDTQTSRLRALGAYSSMVPLGYTAGPGTACGIYSDIALTAFATSPADANFIGCRGVYYVTYDAATDTRREWRHGFTITPNADGSFGYTTRARVRTQVCTPTGCTASDANLQPNFYQGVLTPTRNAAGQVIAFTVTGTLPGAYTMGSNTLANESHEWALQGTRTITAPKQEVSTLSGTVKAFGTGGVLLGTLTVRDGTTLTEQPVADDGVRPSAGNPATGGEISGGTVKLAWTTATAEFDGTLSATDGVWDSTGDYFSPTKATLEGSLRTISNGVTSEFLRGTLNVTASGYGSYNGNLPDSATNRYTLNYSFVGAVAAPGRPRLEISIGATQTTELLEPASLTLQYRSLVNGTPRIVIGATATRDANGVAVISLTEAGANLNLSWRETDTTSDLFQGTTRIGTLTRSTGLMTFVDGSFISLDAGL